MKYHLLWVLATTLMLIGCHSKSDSQEVAEAKQVDTVIVYMTRNINAESLVKIYDAMGVLPASNDRVAVKISTGEMGGNNYLKPELIGDLVRHVNGTIVECNTAYGGSRATNEAHWKTIRAHGFDKIAPVDIMDEEDTIHIPVQDTKHIAFDIVGSHLKNYNYMISLAHFKGHAMGGFGGVLKNQSIGVASSQGKAYIHSAGYTQHVDSCWNHIEDQDGFLESMAAAAQAVHNYFGEKIVYINIMNNMSIDCDCDDSPEAPKIQDIGILASTDPVALDKACLDLLFNITSDEQNDPQPMFDRIKKQHGTHIIDYAENIGLGSKVYKLIYVD